MTVAFRHALVTGGAGFIGSHLVRALLARGMVVTVVDDLSIGRAEAVEPAARLIVGDVRDVALMQSALAGVDVVFHLAARVSIRASVDTFRDDADVNLMGTLALIAAMDGQAVRKLVFASSMAVYPDMPGPTPISEDHPLAPLSPYGIAKMAAERYVVQMGDAMGFDAVTLRFFNVYGPGQTYTPYVGVITIFATRLLQGEVPIIFGNGEQVRDFVQVGDIVQGLIKAMERGTHGRVYNIGSGVGKSVSQVAATVTQALGLSVTPSHVPMQKIETRNSVADISRARFELGFVPKGDFAQDIQPVLAAIRARLGKA